jgi:hypothetical protein
VKSPENYIRDLYKDDCFALCEKQLFMLKLFYSGFGKRPLVGLVCQRHDKNEAISFGVSADNLVCKPY